MNSFTVDLHMKDGSIYHSFEFEDVPYTLQGIEGILTSLFDSLFECVERSDKEV